jgi:Uncharacterized conserved protein
MSLSDARVLGYFGYNNAGDDAFADFWHRVMGVSREHIRMTLKHEEYVNTVCLGGGAVLNDFFIGKLPKSFETLHLVGVSFPYGDQDIKLLDHVKDKLGRVIIRSKHDVSRARELGFDAEFVPDLIFGHEFKEQKIGSLEDLYACASLPLASATIKKKNLIVLLSGDYWFSETWKFNETEVFKNRFARALDDLAPYYNIIMLPLSVWYGARDYLIAGDVSMRMEKKTSCLIVEKYLGPDMLYSIIRQFGDLVVSMKYHGLVFSIAAGVPFINVGSTRKNIHLCADEGLERLSVPFNDFNIDRFWAAVKTAEAAETLDAITDVAENNRKLVSSFVRTFV